METGLNCSDRLRSTAGFAFKHVETGARILLQACLIALAVGAFDVVLKVLLVEAFDMFALELALENHVVLRTQSGFCTELSRDVAHHVLVLAIESGHHRIEILPSCFGGT